MEAVAEKVRIAKYPAYKDSGVEWLGEIPAHWELLKSKYLWEEKIDLSETGNEDLLSVSQYTGVSKNESDSRSESTVGYKKVSENDLVINIMLAWLGGLGLSSVNGLVSPAYAVYRLTKEANPKFLHYLYRTDTYLSEFARRSRGVVPSRWRMYTDDFGQVPTVLPPIREQLTISSYLDRKTAQIENAIARKERETVLLKERRQILIHRAVTRGLNPDVQKKDSGVEWIGEVPEHWRLCSLNYVAKIETGATPDRSRPTYWNGTIPWLKTSEINYSVITETEEYITEFGLKNSSTRLAKPGSLLMAMYGQGVTRGRVSILGIAATYNQACCSINFNESISPIFGYHFFFAAYPFIRDAGNETSQMNLSSGYIEKLKFPIPPIDEQEFIIKHIDQINTKLLQAIECKKSEITKLREYKTILINAVVMGRIKIF